MGISMNVRQKKEEKKEGMIWIREAPSLVGKLTG